MVRTRVGYTGGTKDSPTYRRLGNHTEALQIDFDPGVLSYSEVLERVFERHDPSRNRSSRQYQNAIWFHDDSQRNSINQFVENTLGKNQDPDQIQTRIESLDEFYRAENYHQKYHLRKHEKYMNYFDDLSEKEFTDSTLAARLNGILAGKADHLDYDVLESIDWPDLLERDLRSRVKRKAV